MATVRAMQTFPVRRPAKQSSSARETRGWKLTVLLLGLVSIGWGVGCGLGSYDDLGEPVPGQRWPWVCPEGDPNLWTAAAHARRAWMQQLWTTLQTRLRTGRRGTLRSDGGPMFSRLLGPPSRSPRTARRRARNWVSAVGGKPGRWPSRLAASSSRRARAGELRGRGGNRLDGGVDGCFSGAGPDVTVLGAKGKDDRNE